MFLEPILSPIRSAVRSPLELVRTAVVGGLGWILAAGTWSDAGAWSDAATWNDGA